MAERNLDFDKVINRKNTRCLKYDFAVKRGKPADVLPLWVADMDFETSSYVEDALVARAKEGIFGYSEVQTPYFEIVANWMKLHHNWEIQEDWLIKTPGVVFALAMAVKAYTQPGDSVLIQLPVYYPFSEVIRDNGRKVVSSNLYQGEDNRYHIDFQDFEKKIVEENVKLFFLCNPHNPVGRVWSREEIKRVLDICRTHGVYIIADEIHQDLVIQEAERGGENPFRENIVAAAAGEPGEYDSLLITLTSASKTFNLAGMQNSFVIIPDEKLREEFDLFTTKIHIKDGGNMGYISYTAAYEQGREWLQELRGLIRDNAALLKERLAEGAPKAVLSPLEGTYLQWVDLSAYAKAWEAEGLTAEDFVLQRCGVAPDFGEWFGGEAYKNFIRLNLATSPENVKRIAAGLIHGISALHL